MSQPPRRRLLSAAAGVSVLALTLSGLALGTSSSSAATPHDATSRQCLQSVGAGPTSGFRQRVFAAASKTFGVPVPVLLGVSYMESRWDDHGAAPSTSGGYGPMHLTDISVEVAGQAKGDGSFVSSDGPDSLHTASIAATLTKLDPARLKSEAAANICGGAAVLASYQRDLDKVTGSGSSTAGWYDAVKSYSGATTAADAVVFADRVFATIRSGQTRITNDGQRMQLTAQPGLAAPATQESRDAAKAKVKRTKTLVDCPTSLSCEWIPAPYEQYGATPAEYGNHDVADRPNNLDIDYIVIHNTEASYPTTLQLVQDPTYVSWNYSLRSSDGHIAQHLEAKDVGHHSGNWYFNMHSIGLEHEGFAAQGATWYTEAMYA
ncbi:MAG: N-acetylmuramoyl-L-alanine amidase, partial [Mycobacteriales bacterium]